MRMFNNTSNAFDDQLHKTLLQLKLREDPTCDLDNFKPITFKDFVNFILGPHIATLLIEQDMDDGYENAFETRSRSKAYGDSFFGDVEENLLADIHDRNLSAAKNAVPRTAIDTRKSLNQAPLFVRTIT